MVNRTRKGLLWLTVSVIWRQLVCPFLPLPVFLFFEHLFLELTLNISPDLCLQRYALFVTTNLAGTDDT